ncbi:Uncharacterised protein [Mycobacteroides abscessus subsp. abscessus]|nr:Uncharacterised protein [Mycobacteroides abscessus subsp. abscessus]SKU75495.1 Uncharacterised protein [Mycobacteroides abscessus subsp. abscessus]SKV56413.1 Uncharacterised protein [Mycobacteroides abscessus subsp. abscessus]
MVLSGARPTVIAPGVGLGAPPIPSARIARVPKGSTGSLE